VKLPRDLRGADLARRLQRLGYQVTRKTGSHIRLTAHRSGRSHHVTIPAHDSLKPGTLISILSEIAAFLELETASLRQQLFGI